MISKQNIRSSIIIPHEFPIVYDADCLAMVNQIQNVEGVKLTYLERNSLNNLFLRSKGLDASYANFGDTTLFDSWIAVYPNIGRSLLATKYNAKDPQNTDAAYRCVYLGGNTADGYGVKGNGVNGAIRTFLSQRALANINPTSALFGVVYKDDVTGAIQCGTYNTSPSWDANLWIRVNNPPNYRFYHYDGTYSNFATAKGHFYIHYEGGVTKLYRNGVQHASYGATTRPESSEPTAGVNGSIYFNAINFNNGSVTGYSLNTMMFGYLLSGVSAALAAVWDQIVRDFITELGRKTWT